MACPAAKSAVVIPAVRKGLCNQRVRMVQDILLAHLFGAAAGIKSATLIRAPCARLAGYIQYSIGQASSCTTDRYGPFRHAFDSDYIEMPGLEALERAHRHTEIQRW